MLLVLFAGDYEFTHLDHFLGALQAQGDGLGLGDGFAEVSGHFHLYGGGQAIEKGILFQGEDPQEALGLGMDLPDLACDQGQTLFHHLVVLGVGYPDAFVLVRPVLLESGEEVVS